MNRRQLLAGGIALPFLLSPQARAALVFKSPDNVISKGGLPFLHVRSNVQDTVGIAIAFQGGDAEDGLTGPLVTQTGVDLMFAGSNGIAESEIVETFLDSGGSMWLTANGDRTNMQIKAPSAGIRGAIEIANVVLRHPDFLEKKIARTIEDKARGARQALAWPEAQLNLAFANALAEPHPYLNSLAPEPDRFLAATRKDFQAWHESRFTTRDAVVCVVGDIDQAAAGALVDGLLNGLPQGKGKRELPDVVFKPTPAAPVRLTVGSGNQASLLVAGAYPPTHTVTLDIERTLLTSIFGEGMKSRLSRAVRETLGSTYGLSASRFDSDKLATLAISGRIDLARVDDSIAAVLATWDKMRRDGPDGDEIRDARALWNNRLGTIERDHSGYAQMLRDEASSFGSLNDVGRVRDIALKLPLGSPEGLAIFAEKPLVLVSTPG
ncbi:MAG: insulinase family protein [Proteobacteria bacterium]|nr:insulinase family protein [Pseudomonadota bacterium]